MTKKSGYKIGVFVGNKIKGFWDGATYKSKSKAKNIARLGMKSIRKNVKSGFFPKKGIWAKTKLKVIKK